LSKKKNIPLLVDEAHGGHFPFHPAYPESALFQGADGVVNGLHKTLPVLNQGAVLHVGADLLKQDSVRQAYSLLTTTSPSYLILASIELARSRMEEEGESLLERALGLSLKYQQKISEIPGITCISQRLQNLSGVVGVDPLKVGVSVQDLCISGDELAHLLRTDYQIQVELSDPGLVLAMFSMFHTEEDWERFYAAVKVLASKYYAPSLPHLQVPCPPTPRVGISPRQAFFAAKRRCKIVESKGLLAGEMVAAYPPGIPCLLPGEIITAEIVDYLEYLTMTHAHIHGLVDAAQNSIQVIDAAQGL
jgi:lysine decarboxylase